MYLYGWLSHLWSCMSSLCANAAPSPPQTLGLMPRHCLLRAKSVVLQSWSHTEHLPLCQVVKMTCHSVPV